MKKNYQQPETDLITLQGERLCGEIRTGSCGEQKTDVWSN